MWSDQGLASWVDFHSKSTHCTYTMCFKHFIGLKVWLNSGSMVQWVGVTWKHMGVSWNGGTPKSSILMGFSIINHPFWGTPIFGNPHIVSWCFIWVFHQLHQQHPQSIPTNSPRRPCCSLWWFAFEEFFFKIGEPQIFLLEALRFVLEVL